MRILFGVTTAVGAGAALALLPACTNSGSATSAPALLQSAGRATTSATRGGGMLLGGGRPDSSSLLRLGRSPVKGFRSSALLQPGGAAAFISDYDNGVIYVLNRQGTLTATLTGFSEPAGLATDASGNLWVANQGTFSILELAPPYSTVTKTLSDPDGYPLGVAVDGNGNVAATDISGSSGAGNVVLYAAGSTSPTGLASNASFPSPRFCAFDAHGDLLFDDFTSSSATNLGAILRGNINNMSAPIVTLTTTNTIVFPGGVQFTASDDPSIGDQEASPPSIYTYAAPRGTNLGSPIATTPEDGTVDPINFAFTPGSRQVLTPDEGTGDVDLYAFPAGGSPLKTVSISGASYLDSAAIVPTEQFLLH